MKKITLLLMTSILLLASTVEAQHDIDINAAGIFYKNFGIDYEYIIQDQMGVGLSFTYAQNTLGVKLDKDAKFSAIDIVPEFKFYSNPSQGGDQVYISSYLKYKNATWEDMMYKENTIETTYNLSFSGLALGFQGGFKKVFPSNFYIELSAGVGRYIITNWNDTANPKLKLSDAKNDTKNNTYADNFMYNWDFRFALGLGWRFGGY